MVKLEDIQAMERCLLFHGTIENIEGKLRPGGFDKVLWTAQTSAVAQAYISVSGGTTYITLYVGWADDEQYIKYPETREPHRPLTDKYFWAQVYQGMGVVPDIRLDKHDRVDSWRWLTTDGQPTRVYEVDVAQYFESLGYKGEWSRGRVTFEINQHRDRILRGGEKTVGSLYIIRGLDQLRIYDYASETESDLMNPAYLHLGKFRAVAKAGYDGILIEDFLQSKYWGNFGHRSVGLFPSAMTKIDYDVVPAVRYDSEDIEGWKLPTPEFADYARRVLTR